MNRKKFFKRLIDTNQQQLWLAEYNVEMARDGIRESYKRIPYLEKEIDRKEEEFAKIQEEEVKKGLMQYHYEKVKKAKQYIKELYKEIEGEEGNIRNARALIVAEKNKLIQAKMKIEEETKHLNRKGFNLEDEIDKKPKVDEDKSKSESK